MQALHGISLAGLVVLGVLALALIVRGVVRKGITLFRRSPSPSPSRTPFEVFAMFIPVRHPQLWAGAFLAVFLIFLTLLIISVWGGAA
jgi:hypothetical protein